jgi:Tol biopolymer transport system component
VSNESITALRHVLIKNFETGEEIVINNSVGAGNVVWSPDGEVIAYTTYREGVREICIYDVESDKSECEETIPNTFETNFAWSPDSRTIAFQRLNLSSELEEIIVMGVETREMTVISEPRINQRGFIDRGKIYFSEDGEFIFATLITNGVSQPVLLDINGDWELQLTETDYDLKGAGMFLNPHGSSD